MPLHQYAKWGGLSLPIPIGDTDGTNLNFSDTDPLQSVLVGLLSQALTSELATVWTLICAGFPDDHPLYNSTTPVADTLELEPSPDLMKERVAGWPLLAVHRTGDVEMLDQSIQYQDIKQAWQVHWILGPRQGAVMDRKLLNVLQAAGKIIDIAIEDKSHPDYDSGAVQFYGATLDDPPLASSVKVMGWGAGQATFAGDENGAKFHALRVDLEIVEVWRPDTDAFTELDGMSTHVGGGGAVEILPDLVIGDTDYVGDYHE